jgi:hypothetical protein
MKDDDQKKFTLQLAIDSECFYRALPILVRCKTKGADGAVVAFLRK